MPYKKKRPKLYVIDNGRMKMDKNLMIANYNLATLDNPNAPAEMIEFPIYTVLIDHPDGKILFDSSCHPDAMGPNGRWNKSTQGASPWFSDKACYLPNRLEQLNIRPESIRFVVASHLHMDHGGCLEMFTNATIIVHDAELNGALRIHARNQGDDDGYSWGDIDAWTKKALRWQTVKPDEDDLTLVEGIKVLNFGSGHARGMLGLYVKMPEKGPIILASDAIYTAENVGPPAKLPGAVYDSVGWHKTLRRICLLAKETGAEVWHGHDADQFKQLRKSTEGYYE